MLEPEIKRIVLSVLVLGACASALPRKSATQEIPRRAVDEAIAIGHAAPNLRLAKVLQAPEGFEASWEALKGRVVILEFWATWCLPCIPALDHLGELQGKFSDRSVLVLGISPEDPERMARFLERRRVAFPVALDEQRRTFEAYGIRGVPATVVVDREGRIAARVRPEQVTLEVLDRVLSGEPAGLPFTTDVPVELDWSPEFNEEGEVFASVVFAESSARGGGHRFGPGGGRISADGAHLLNLIQVAWDVPNTRLISSLPPRSPKDQRYKASVVAPGGDDELARRMLQGALRAKFGIEARWEQREVEVRVLRQLADGPGWRESKAPESKRTSSAFGGGLTMIGQPIEYLRSWFENTLQQPVIDETGLSGRYDVEMTWVDSQTFHEEVARLGLALDSDRRLVKVLVVTSR